MYTANRVIITLLIAAVFLEGCAANSPKIVLDQNGPANANTPGISSTNIFNTHLDSLYSQTLGTPLPSGKQPVTAVQVTREGANLAYQLCSSFFRTAGKEQQYLLFSRDLIALLGTFATGALGAVRGSEAATAWVGIGSGAALSTIGVYARNFLFSEDNVQAVQNLTLKAMAAQTAASLEQAGRSTDYGFMETVRDVMDIQAVCEVQNILSLVRNSIGQAQPVATPGPGGRITTDVGPQQASSIEVIKGPDTPLSARTRSREQRVQDAQRFFPPAIPPSLVSSVRSWQRALCVSPDDGQIGQETQRAIREYLLLPSDKTVTLGARELEDLGRVADTVGDCRAKGFANAFEVRSYGMGGSDAITQLQQKLNAKLRNVGPQIVVNSKFDKPTREAIKRVRDLAKIDPSRGGEMDNRLDMYLVDKPDPFSSPS